MLSMGSEPHERESTLLAGQSPGWWGGGGVVPGWYQVGEVGSNGFVLAVGHTAARAEIRVET